jgi:hypothetical protein
VAIATGSYEEVGPRSGRKAARRTAAGALVGFAAGGPAVCAAIGAADWAYRQRQVSRNLVRVSTDAADFRVTRNGMASDRFS